MNNFYRNRFIFYLTGFILGIVIGFVYYLLSNQNALLKSLVWGALIGLFFTFLFTVIRPDIVGYKCKEIHLTIPQFSDMTFIIDDLNKHVAWSLFIETITRISTQSLGSEEGFLFEALNSLHSLFQTTRDLLKSMEPSTNVDTKQMTVEMFAISLLNKELRPFLSKWHPLIENFKSKNPDKSERDWELNTEFRKELEELRKNIINYAIGFGELAEVKNLDYFFRPKGGENAILSIYK